jgi:hypothetical protein
MSELKHLKTFENFQLNEMKTNKDYLVKGYKGGGTITYPDFIVPKGTRLTHMTTSGIDKNYHFVDDFSFLGEDEYGLKHDLKFYGLNVTKEYVEY